MRHHYRADWGGPTTSSGPPSTTSTAGAGRCHWAPELRPGRSSRRCSPRSPTTSTPRAVAAVDRWVDATLGTDGLADTSDPDAAVRLLGLVDAALGLSLWPR